MPHTPLIETSQARPEAAPSAIEAVGVVGAGLMASQLALLFAQNLRVPVKISDLSADRVQSALARIRDRLSRQEAQGRLPRGEAAKIGELISGTTSAGEFAGCEAVIEAVFEELPVKQAVFREVEKAVSSKALLLTNTSSLSVGSIARGLDHPERVVGFHVFNPVAVLPLLELVRSPLASDRAIADASALAARVGKTAVPVADSPGFVVNRLLTRLFAEILREVDGGGDPLAVDRALAPWQLPMTPLALIGYIGPVVQLKICDTLHRAFPDRFPRSTALSSLVASGLTGFLGEDGRTSPEVTRLLPPPHPVDQHLIRRRVRDALAEETRLMLEEGVVASVEDIDRCMVLGANYPAGGLTPLLAR